MSSNAPGPALTTDADAVAAAFQQLRVALSQLTVSRLRFTLRLQAPLEGLPPYYGSMLRGGLGVYFRQLVCVQPHLEQCRACTLLPHCAFPYVFETPLPPGLTNAPHLQEVSPYILAPVTPAGTLQTDESLVFDLLLFGKAISYLPYFVISYRQLGSKGGLGRRHVRFVLDEVTDETPGYIPQTLYAQASGSINLQPHAAPLNTLLPMLPTTASNVRLLLQTPLRLKVQSKITHTPTFQDLWAALLRRLAQLVLVHGTGQWNVDEPPLFAAAATVQTTNSKLHTEPWERFSQRQQQTIQMGGVVGEITFGGDIHPFLPLLWAGQYLHLGRGATFGNGQYSVRL